MSKMPSSEIVVLDVADGRAMVKVGCSADVAKLIALGFILVDHVGERQISDMDERAYVVKKLIALGAIFCGGRGWSPAEVVNYLQDQRWVNTEFRSIEWVNPDRSVISEV